METYKEFIWEEVSSVQQEARGGSVQVMEEELAAKTLAVEELSRELEEFRMAFGSEGVQQLQDFKAALKQRDGIITQLTANLQQSRKEKDEVMREFLEMTEQSQKLHIQFQQLQAGETLRNTSHSSTAQDLLQAKQQLVQYQQQLEEMDSQVRGHQMMSKEMTEETFAQKMNEKELLIAEQERVMSEHDFSLHQLKGELTASEKCLNGLNQQMSSKAQELETSRQKERMSSSEIQQLMGTVEDLQKRFHQGSLSESDTLQRMEEDSARRLEHLRAELDEMYGEQIVQMKLELRLQHSAALERVTEQHREDLALLRAQQPAPSPSPEVGIEHKGKIAELQQRLQEAQALHEKARQDLTQVAQEKLNLQGQVTDLLQDLRSAHAKMEQASQNFAVHERCRGELQRFQETINDLKAQLAAAAESAEEIEAKHESETTNYKIKLEMMEREKDAVLDRMAESQESELERLRTQLLFSHEEELILLREDLQRESHLNVENLLNEASIRHSRALEELRNGYEVKRDELLHQIVALKDDLKMALHSSKAEELVAQLKELQLEVEELRKGGEESVRMEREIQMLLKKNELLENESKERETSWDNKWRGQESENRILMETNNAMKEEVESKTKKCKSLTIENEQKQRQVVELQEEIEKQRNTFSFAEKNFEVNYQELKEEYTCLVEVKAQLEERILKGTLVFESQLASLQSQIQELREIKENSQMEDNGGAPIEKDTTELMEKLKVSLTEKEELAVRLSEVTEQLTVTEGELDELEGELSQVKRENKEVLAQNENLEEELERERETLKERKGVIVQMSVEFAQQSELARISKSARETTSAMQTQSEEEEEQQTPRSSLAKGISPEAVQRKFVEDKERLERELEERTAELPVFYTEYDNVIFLYKWVNSKGALKEQYYNTKKVHSKTDLCIDYDKGPQPKRYASCQPQTYPKHLFEVNERPSFVPPTFIVFSSFLRNLLRKANESLRQVLSDVLKTTAAAEETIGRHVEGLLSSSHSCQRKSSPARLTDLSLVDASVTESCQGSEPGVDDVSMWSGETDEGLEMSQQMMTDSHSLLPELQLENEEYLMNISSRLQAAVEKLLVAITETTNQLEHARVTQTELMRESFRHNQEMGDLLRRQEDLQERLVEEGRAREQLALELHRAEGLIDGYTGERAALEEQVRQKEELQLSLEQELQVTSSRLHELEQERLQMQEEREILSRQQDAMREHAGPRELRLVEAAVDAAPEADLLEETEKLMAEKVEVQRQAEKESLDLLHQVKTLEAELEEQINRVIELEHARKTESGDLLQQIQALEKQLEKNRRFLDEQAVDREHERDVFQQEILKLEQQLKNSQKQQPGSEQRSREVDQLTQQLREKADWCSELLLASEQLQREVGERNEEIDKLEGRIRELEQALLASTETVRVDDKRQHVSVRELGDSSLEAQLQTEREALDRKEKEISNLEEQLEQFREELENKSDEVQQLHMQLEIQRKELSTQQQDLETKDRLLQVIGQHTARLASDYNLRTYDKLLKVMEEKDREIALLNEQMAKLQHTETAPDNKEINARDELLWELESQVECMRSEQQRLKKNSEEELEQLNAVIDKLQEELANIERKQSSETDEELKGQLESQVGGPSKEEYDEMKQKMDLATQELDTIKSEQCMLLERYRCLQESRLALAESEKEQSDDTAMELQDALREKTAEFLVVQAQIQALEQSAASRLEELSNRVQELEACVRERDSELIRCRFLVERAQEDADELQSKVQDLEDKLRERVAAALVSQAQLGAVQQQSHQLQESKGQRTKESGHQDPQGQMEVILLTEKLRELEVGLSGMQKDQELQKQLLSSSEEEVLEYEKRLVMLMDLLNQMRTTKPGDGATASKLLQELQEVREEAVATKENLNSFRECSDKLQNELQVRDLSIAQLQEELQQLRVALAKTAESPSPQSPLSPSQSPSPQQQSVSEEEVEEMIGEYQEKIIQMQELHAAEILDMEARHIAESEALKRDAQMLEEECKVLKTVIEKLQCSHEVSSLGDISADLNSSSEWSQRTGYDLPNLQQEFRTTPEGARKETDDALPDRIKNLLREVHQEGMQVLSLSELTIPEGEADPASLLHHAQGWPKERGALLATVESLKALIAQMQTHSRETQFHKSYADWRGELLGAVQQVFVRERSVLKSTLYARLDQLDTSDAVIHLNHLEHRLAEQDAHHRDAMGMLQAADRSSLLTEIRQLQAQLQQIQAQEPGRSNQGLERGAPQAGLCGVQEPPTLQQADRALLEELKGELAQTKLELETTLQAQQKHLKELDTVRTEVSQKAAEVDTLTDRLAEKQKKAREMQWALEKEKCKSDKKEELESEELEDLKLALEEQQSHVAQLTSELDQQRQSTSQLSIQAEQERSRLQTQASQLHIQLESERARAQELNGALGREKELRQHSSSWSESPERKGAESGEDEVVGGAMSSEALLEGLRREMDKKHAQVGCLFVDEADACTHTSTFTLLYLHTDISSLLCLQSTALLAGGQSSSLTERLLRQNAELTGFVSRLTEEKNDLRNQVLRLEDELRRYRQTGLGSGDSSSRRGGVDKQQEATSLLFSSERESWTRERSRLEKGLRLAQAEVTRLRGEIRTESLRDMTGPDTDNATLKRMYGKYLRSESFRKALIYQKKYLLLLLGGFQECEEATLSLIARMGGQPSHCSLESPTQRRRGLTRFRSAVRVSIALSRMRFLVKRWHKATGMRSITSGNVNRNGLGQSPGNEVRTDSPYLHPGSVEVYGEIRGASRGLTGRDSPSSALSSAQHRFHMAGDPLTCSHLQNYDPDRALTDYISRLEALQRRLGSVQSGSSSYAQLHFGIRR
uniref:Pericentrin/AKAP-450 centrosomal targeting domain-containing protein n=1 Tax=Salmo trutta TaxID=8032 RepID=A0A674BWQ5_SALTR